MSNYKYTIKKLPIKSWIKYWLWRNRTGGTKYKFALSEIKEGSNFYLENTIKRKFNMFEIFGKTTQDGIPTPENPIPFLNLTGEIKEKVQNKNLWGNNDWSIETYAYFKLPKEESRYVLSVKLKQGKTIPSNLSLGFSEYGKFVLGQNVSWLISNGSYSSGASVKDDTYYRVRTNLNYVSIYPASIKDTITEYFDIQLEENNELSSYIEHEEQNITFPLAQGQYLAEGDYLADDGIHHVRAKIVLDGSETIIEHNTQNNIKSFRITIADLLLANSVLLSNMFINVTWAVFNSNRDFYRVSAYRDSTHYLYFSQPNENITSVDDFKAFLAEQYSNGTPVEVEYELEEEYIEPYTEAQQINYNQIKDLYTYNVVTNINGNANLKIKYWERVER